MKPAFQEVKAALILFLRSLTDSRTKLENSRSLTS